MIGALIAKSKVNSEFLSIIRNHRTYRFAESKLGLIIFNSKFRMSGYIASALQTSVGVDTLIAINQRTKRGSLRGDLALYWKGIFDGNKNMDYVTVGGHPKYMGISITKNPEVFIEDLTEMLM